MLHGNISNELTPREFANQQHEKDMTELHATHAEKMATINYEATKLDIRWGSWLKIPILLIKLPVYILIAFCFLIQSFRKEPKYQETLLDFLRR